MARGGPTPRGIEADPAEGGPRNAGGPGPTPGRAGRRGALERGRRPRTRAGRRRVASRPIRRRGSQGTRAGRGRRRNGRTRRWSGGGDPSLPLLSPQVTFRGRRAPPRTHGGGGGHAEGRMPDPSGPGWALGANRPPAGRMTRAGRSGTSPAPGAVAGRPAAGGLSSGTVALGGHEVRQPKALDGPWTQPGLVATGMPESARAGWSLSGPGVHLAGARAEDLGGGLRARISPLGIDRPIAGRMTLPADRRPASQPGVGRERRATFAGPVVHLGGTLAIPDRVWRRSPMSCARVSGLFGSHPILGNVARQGFGIAGYNALFKVYITDILILTNVNEIACKLIIRLVLRG